MEIFVFAVVKLDIVFTVFPNPTGAVGEIGLWGAVEALGMDGVFGITGKIGTTGCIPAGNALTTADMVAPPDDEMDDGIFVPSVWVFARGIAAFFDVTLDDCVFLTTTGVLFAQITVE